MEFSLEFYETSTGHCPVREFLDELKDTDPDDFASVLAGLGKLRNRRYHREPLSKALVEGLFELRHVGKLNTRVLWFSQKGGASSSFMAFAAKGRLLPLTICARRANAWQTGRRGRNENDQFRSISGRADERP